MLSAPRGVGDIPIATNTPVGSIHLLTSAFSNTLQKSNEAVGALGIVNEASLAGTCTPGIGSTRRALTLGACTGGGSPFPARWLHDQAGFENPPITGIGLRH